MTDIVERDLDLFRKDLKQPAEESIWHKHCLLRNPFPGSREIIPDVCVSQKEVKDGFRQRLVACYNDKRGDSLHIVGDTGAGKTNILRYYETLINRLRVAGLTPGLFPIYVSHPGDTFLEVHNQMVSVIAQWFFIDLFEKVKAHPKGLRTAAQEFLITPSLVTAIEHVVGSHPLFNFDFPKLEIFQRCYLRRKTR